MVVPTAVAFAPIWHLLLAMVVLLLLTLLAAGWLSTRLAARIARPIMSLTEFTRRYRKGEQCKPLGTPTTLSEVGELTRAYTDMIAGAAVSGSLQLPPYGIRILRRGS